jgi:SAM-dependent methyltransferase
VHDAVERLVSARFPAQERASVRVLDLAAGHGALTLRLRDLGFRDLTAFELEAEKFVPDGVVLEQVDLNTRFSEGRGQYGLVVAVEIVEHLENPFQFLREIAALLGPDGTLLLSTPNIESAVGRVQFLLSGRFRWFDDLAFREYGHIMPISTWQLHKILDAAGLEVVRRTSNTAAGVHSIDGGRLDPLKGLLALALSPVMRGHRDGDIHVWEIRAAAPRRP